MSTAHRPTWDPAQAKDVKGGSRQFSVRDMAAHTKLKFRWVLSVVLVCGIANAFIKYRQPGQTSAAEVSKRDLRAELLAAEAEAREKKRKAEGKPALTLENGNTTSADDEVNKRRKLLQEALEMDKDDDEDEDGSESGAKKADDNEESDKCV